MKNDFRALDNYSVELSKWQNNMQAPEYFSDEDYEIMMSLAAAEARDREQKERLKEQLHKYKEMANKK